MSLIPYQVLSQGSQAELMPILATVAIQDILLVLQGSPEYAAPQAASDTDVTDAAAASPQIESHCTQSVLLYVAHIQLECWEAGTIVYEPHC